MPGPEATASTSGHAYPAYGHYHRNAKSFDLGLGLRTETPHTISRPLPDDFDAITTQRWSRTTRATTADPRASALVDQLEAVTRATTPAPSGFTKSRRRRNRGNSLSVIQDHSGNGEERSLRRMRGKDRIKSGEVVNGNGSTQLGPAAGQNYEIVEQRVLEAGPERTVSISKWREQVILETDSDDDMSIYYLNAEGFVRNRGGGPEFLCPGKNVRSTSGGGGSNGSKERNAQSSGSSGRCHPIIQVSDGKRNTALSEQQRGSTRGVTSGIKTDPPGGSKKTAPSLSRRSSPPRASTPRGSGTLIQPPDAPASPLFHAKKSNGSSISSIRLAPVNSESSVTLEDLLVACKPSLLHLSPILQRVGIRGLEHLRAVGKLSEDTRNKEVREEVLKLGVTVVEWAILLDRLRAL